ncbi:YdcF family protein [Vibrio scophthalmi]|uniref:YdcF family protein n=1 Tax=Vibrio scophthalmi TaxID=45658 RepID=UPI003AAB6A0A
MSTNIPLFRHIDTLWQYMQLDHDLTPADCIFVLGSNDPRVAELAAQIYRQGLAGKILFSGGFGRLTEGVFPQSEAETFAAIAQDLGVPAEDIIIEKHSTNSGENVLFSAQRLQELKLNFTRFILVQKPYMERRAYATFLKQWPLPVEHVTVTSTKHSFSDYFTEDIDLFTVLEAMMGDFERIKSYPAKGFQIEQPVPAEVDNAYQAIRESLAL